LTAPYTQFGKTLDVPIKVYVEGKLSTETTWDFEFWIERGEDWYAFMSSDFKDKKVRVITREAWLQADWKKKFGDRPYINNGW
jgi:hypothetical protein